jgi:DNA-binding LacI/PurR family transcriptional regulator
MVPTIEDVARRAGVSRSTVSYALSGKRSISRETRERIEAAIAELGFTPNAGARALATSQTMVIGLFVQFFEDEFSPAMLQYVLPISDAAREAGYDILMVTEADGPRAVQRILSSGMVDGVILLNVAHEDPRLPVMRTMKQPGSMVGLPRNPEGFDVFDLDFAESGRIVVDHLAERGHRAAARTHGGSGMRPSSRRPATESAYALTSARRNSLPSTGSSTRFSTREASRR